MAKRATTTAPATAPPISKIHGRLAATTRAQIEAKYLAPRPTVAGWLKSLDFPGGLRGPWYIAEVDEWLRSRKSPYGPRDGAAEISPHTVGADARADLAKSKAALARIELESTRGEVLTVAQAVEIYGALIIEGMAQLNQLPDFVIAKLPNLKASSRAHLRAAIVTRIEDIRNTLAEGLESGTLWQRRRKTGKTRRNGKARKRLPMS